MCYGVFYLITQVLWSGWTCTNHRHALLWQVRRYTALAVSLIHAEFETVQEHTKAWNPEQEIQADVS